MKEAISPGGGMPYKMGVIPQKVLSGTFQHIEPKKYMSADI